MADNLELLEMARRLVKLGGPDVMACGMGLNRDIEHARVCGNVYMRTDALEILLEWAHKQAHVRLRAQVLLKNRAGVWRVIVIPSCPPHRVGYKEGSTPTEAVLKAAIWLQEREVKDA